jgi:diguanylate cyclase (GGDEF)-like protein
LTDVVRFLTILDGRTMFIAGALVAGVFTLVMLVTLRVGKTYPGYGSWALSELSFAILFFLKAIQGRGNDFIPVVLGNLFSCCAMMMLSLGMHRFTGRHMRYLTMSAAAIVFLAISMYFYFVLDDLRIRAIAISIYLSIMAVHAAGPLLRHSSVERRFGSLFTLSVLGFGSLIGIVRVLALLRITELPALYTGRPIETAYYLFDLMFIIGITFSFFILTNERTVADLLGSNLALEREAKEREKTAEALLLEVAQRRKLEIELKELTNTDELTGVLNRRGIFDVLQREVHRVVRHQHPLALLIIDLDDFKSVNDRYGHTGGDKALAAVVETCKGNLRVTDMIGRLGGDEFIVILPETAFENAIQVCEKIRASIENSAVISGGDRFSLTVSIGAAPWADGDDTGALTIAEADNALYRAKGAGRNCVRTAPPPATQNTFS